jgi:hypothetical protein
MTAITNCVVSRNNANVITNPTSADVQDDMKPTVTVTVTGGNVATPLVNNAAYKITGTVGVNNRTWLNMKCKSTNSPYSFKL